MLGLDAGAAHPWVVLCVALAAYVLKRLYLDWFYLDHWRRIPGPPRQHPLFGNWRELVQDGSPLQVGIQWRQQYGPVVRMACAWGRTRLVISDKRALRHIMTEHAYEYPKPDDSRRELAFVVGDGLLSSEGDVHRKQKRILGPVFSAYRTDRLGPLFLSLSARFAKVLLDLTRTGPTEADMCPLMSRFTLDVIGLAGFGEDLKCISGQGSAFAHSVHTLLQGEPVQVDLPRLLLGPVFLHAPWLLKWLPVERVQKSAKALGLIQARFREIYAHKSQESVDIDDTDLLSTLIKANRAADAKHRISDAEMTDQASTMLIAGHETTAQALCYAALHLAQHPQVQTELRQEIRTYKAAMAQAGRDISIEGVQALPLLKAFSQEVLRFSPPVDALSRVATHDDIIPLSRPITLTDGTQVDHLAIPKGTELACAIGAFNFDEELFPEPFKFDPSRWLSAPSEDLLEATKGFSPYSHLTTFSASGPRTCIGYRFAVAEFQAAIFEMIDAIRFSETVAKPKIVSRVEIVLRPFIDGQFDKPRLPLIIEAA